MLGRPLVAAVGLEVWTSVAYYEFDVISVWILVVRVVRHRGFESLGTRRP